MSYLLTFCAGVLATLVVVFGLPAAFEWVQFHRMMRDMDHQLDSALTRMKAIVPPRPVQEQPDPSWRVVK